MKTSTINTFLELLRCGLWQTDATITEFDFEEILLLAEDQSVIGLIAAGSEHTLGVSISKQQSLQLAGAMVQIEQRNAEQNLFIARAVDKLRSAGINALLVKGQGIAQCYERPEWRASGDVDLFLESKDFSNAVDFMMSKASYHKPIRKYSKELGLNIGREYIELHGTLRTGLSGRVDRAIDAVQRDTFNYSRVRVWKDGDTDVLIPAADNDVIFVFTHFVKHFYKGGMNLRQLCDWCRLMWTYRDVIDPDFLEKHIRRMGLVYEWNSFAALAVDHLGMPASAMPLYSDEPEWHAKGDRLLRHILHYGKSGYFTIAMVFPLNTLRFLPSILFNLNGLKVKELLFGGV